MSRALVGITFGIATVVGGIYLYKKYGGGKRKRLVTNVAGVILGDRVGEIAGMSIAGPAGAIVGSVVGAVGGAIIAKDYLGGDDKPEGVF